jgi:DNA-binding response OmpR family regulator
MKSVAVLDDDESILEVLSLILTEAEYEVQTFTHPDAFFEQRLGSAPDVVLLDVFIGKKDGREVCTAIKQRMSPSVPVILMSADMSLPNMAKQAGADAWVEKPFNIDEIIEVVEKYAH